MGVSLVRRGVEREAVSDGPRLDEVIATLRALWESMDRLSRTRTVAARGGAAKCAEQAGHITAAAFLVVGVGTLLDPCDHSGEGAACALCVRSRVLKLHEEAGL